MTAAPTVPLITLTTDFGLTDHYVGTMKGVILSRCPTAQIEDISHGVAPFSVVSGAYTISQAAPYYPDGSIHVVVVDPGVGTSRRAIAVRADGQMFIAPDNGVLTIVLNRSRSAEIREIVNESFFLHPVSSTFHGRDIFASVAAALGAGASFDSVGPLIADVISIPCAEPEAVDSITWRGMVLSVDRFGNIVTNFSQERFADGVLFIGGVHVSKRYQTFGAAPEKGLFLYTGSSGYIEVGINRASAAEALRIAPGDTLQLTLVQ